MKLLLNAVVAVFASMFILTLSACDGDNDGVVPSGDIVTRTFDLTDFDGVKLNLYDTEIEQSDEFSIAVRVDDNLADAVDADITGTTLDLQFEPDGVIRGNVTLEAIITMPTVKFVEVTGAGVVSVEGFGAADSIDLWANGASSLEGTFNASNMSLSLSGASSADLVVTTGLLDASLSGASSVTGEGSVDRLLLDLSGASNVDLPELTVETASVELSGASHALVKVDEEIAPVTLSGASTLEYLGDPDLGDVSTTGASTVDRAD
jgi:hypothetical protein